jgi:hypothetical protein
MNTPSTDAREADRTIADALHEVHDLVVQQARNTSGDQRRNGILNSLACLLQRPVRAAELLAEGDRARSHHQQA